MERTILDKFNVTTDSDGSTVFSLKNDASRPPRATFTSEPTRQRTLLAGLDCLPGQVDFLDDMTDETPNGDSDNVRKT